MATVTYRNSNGGDTVAFDLANDDDKRAVDNLTDNWEKVPNAPAGETVAPVEVPGEKASRDELLAYVKAHASDAEQATVEQMTVKQLRGYIAGDGPVGV